MALTFPVFLTFGSVRLHPHVVFETLAYTMGYLVFRALRARQGDIVAPNDRWSVIAAAAVGGLLGSKLLFALENPTWTLSAPIGTVLGGKTIVGGLVGGLIVVEWVKRRAGVTVATGDLFAIPLSVGIAIGRIGCFLTGLSDGTAGTSTTMPWGVDFGDGISRHPTQLYEIAFLLILSAVLWYLQGRAKQGDIFKLFMVSYLAFRLLIDILKPDVRLGLGLSAIQWTCLLTLAYYARHFARRIRADQLTVEGA